MVTIIIAIVSFFIALFIIFPYSTWRSFSYYYHLYRFKKGCYSSLLENRNLYLNSHYIESMFPPNLLEASMVFGLLDPADQRPLDLEVNFIAIVTRFETHRWSMQILPYGDQYGAVLEVKLKVNKVNFTNLNKELIHTIFDVKSRADTSGKHHVYLASLLKSLM